ncbi:GNAT family N-acetyltransferase [Paenibacillus sp. JNUCC31]|nr:GNAT family N-acetyltransferase [Paenibacillus sp. JNUCC-31]
MSTPYTIARLTKSDKPSFVFVLSKAFARDPLFLYLFGDSEMDEKARSRVIAFVSFMFDKAFLVSEEVWGLFENECLLGAYIVEKPEKNKLQNMKEGFLLMGRFIPLFFQMSVKSLWLLNSYMRVTRSAAPRLSHHYLIMIGVIPKSQGKGIGKSLLMHLMKTINGDTHSQGIALDTENQENVNMYCKWGFTLNKEIHIDNLRVYCMFYHKQSHIVKIPNVLDGLGNQHL